MVPWLGNCACPGRVRAWSSAQDVVSREMLGTIFTWSAPALPLGGRVGSSAPDRIQSVRAHLRRGLKDLLVSAWDARAVVIASHQARRAAAGLGLLRPARVRSLCQRHAVTWPAPPGSSARVQGHCVRAVNARDRKQHRFWVAGHDRNHEEILVTVGHDHLDRRHHRSTAMATKPEGRIQPQGKAAV